MSNRAGWEVEGFVDRLTRRDDTNSERLVLEAISHLRAFSRDCDALRENNRANAAEIERLRGLGRELDDAICDLRNVMPSPLLVEFGGIYTRLVAIQMKFRAALSSQPEVGKT